MRRWHTESRARDRWIGWDFRHQYDHLSLIANNSRFFARRFGRSSRWHVTKPVITA